MRLQLTWRTAVLATLALGAGVRMRGALADDRVETKTTLMIEPGEGIEELRIVHPQLDIGLDLGSSLEVNAGYEADIVSGATPRVYDVALDAVSSATKFSDIRHSGRGGFAYKTGETTLSASYSYGIEEDYRSHAMSFGMVTELNGKNTTLGLRYGHNYDTVCDADNADREPLERRALDESTSCYGRSGPEATVTHSIGIDHYQATLTQNLSPVAVVQFGVDGQVIRGFQSNPYRRVRVYDLEVQEVKPESRERLSGFMRLNYALPSVASAINLMARFYADSWAIESGTVDLTYHQYLAGAPGSLKRRLDALDRPPPLLRPPGSPLLHDRHRPLAGVVNQALFRERPSIVDPAAACDTPTHAPLRQRSTPSSPISVSHGSR